MVVTRSGPVVGEEAAEVLAGVKDVAREASLW